MIEIMFAIKDKMNDFLKFKPSTWLYINDSIKIIAISPTQTYTFLSEINAGNTNQKYGKVRIEATNPLKIILEFFISFVFNKYLTKNKTTGISEIKVIKRASRNFNS